MVCDVAVVVFLVGMLYISVFIMQDKLFTVRSYTSRGAGKTEITVSSHVSCGTISLK